MKIVYTYTDEAPALATHSLLPILEAYAAKAGVEVEVRDISLAARILAQFPAQLGDRAEPDALAELGQLATTAEANIIKLPNVSLGAAAAGRHRGAPGRPGTTIPDYPESPVSDARRRPPAPRTTRSRAARSIRSSGRATPTGGRPLSVKAYRAQPPALDGRLVDRSEATCRR